MRVVKISSLQKNLSKELQDLPFVVSKTNMSTGEAHNVAVVSSYILEPEDLGVVPNDVPSTAEIEGTDILPDTQGEGINLEPQPTQEASNLSTPNDVDQILKSGWTPGFLKKFFPNHE